MPSWSGLQIIARPLTMGGQALLVHVLRPLLPRVPAVSEQKLWRALSGLLEWLAPPVLVSIAYFAAAQAAFWVGTLSHFFAPFWPPNVVLLFVMLLVPERRWWIFVLAALPPHLIAEWQAGMPVSQALLAFVSNCIVALFSAAALRRFVDGPPWFSSLDATLTYLAIAVVASPALVACLAALEPVVAGGDPGIYWTYWWRWYLSNALGALTLGPFFLVWLRPHLPRLQVRRSWLEAVTLVAGLVAISSLSLDFPPVLHAFLPSLLYAPVPIVIWAAVRFGSVGASGAVFVVTVASVWHAMHGHGPFSSGSPGDSVFALQLYLVVFSAPVLLLAALVEQLSATNNRLSSILATISECYFMLDRKWRFTDINQKAAGWWNAAAHSLVGQPYALVNPLPGSQHIRQAVEGGDYVHAEIAGRALSPKLPPDTVKEPVRWLELHAYPSADGVSVFFRDITARKLADEALRQSEERFRAMAETVPDILFTSLPDGSCDYISPRFYQYSGLAADTATGFGWTKVVHPEDLPRLREARGDATRIGAAFEQEFRLRSANGQYRWFLGRWRPMPEKSSDRVKWFGALVDIDEMKQVQERLRELTRGLLAAQDDERRRIARELHDSTAQNLIGATLAIDQALDSSVTLVARLRESRDLIVQSLSELRTLSYLLHPPMLDDIGLPAAIQWYAEGLTTRSGIKIDVTIAPTLTNQRLPAEVEAALYRIAQEALTNVHRHATATHAHVRLHCEETAAPESIFLALEIKDNGTGMRSDPALSGDLPVAARQEHGRTTGVGLVSIAERVRQLGGTLEISSGPDGMRVRATVHANKAGFAPSRWRA